MIYFPLQGEAHIFADRRKWVISCSMIQLLGNTTNETPKFQKIERK